MSTNISDLMYEMECAGLPKPRVAEIVIALLRAGQRSVSASLGEAAGEREATEAELQGIVANLVARSHKGLGGVVVLASSRAETAKK